MRRRMDAKTTALTAASVALHWLAVEWDRFPSVAAEIRSIADDLAKRARRRRDESRGQQ